MVVYRWNILHYIILLLHNGIASVESDKNFLFVTSEFLLHYHCLPVYMDLVTG